LGYGIVLGVFSVTWTSGVELHRPTSIRYSRLARSEEVKTRTVPSGSFVVETRRQETLEAYLGTCVGVTLVDRKAGVGGLLHILLPEPTGTDIPFGPAVYATTGLPKFVGKLKEAGARISELRGCIGGGGLVGEVQDQDLWLDIGGRTAEKVEDILRENGITLEQVETGGYYSCKMALNLDTLNTTIEPLMENGPCQIEEGSRIRKEDLLRAIQEVRPIPQIALKIIRMLKEDDYDVEDVAMEVRQDQVISAKVLKLANSAFIGTGSSIDSIDRALILLGEKKLFQLVLSATVEMLFAGSKTGGYSLCKGGIFHHALAAAMTAHEISVFTGRSRPDIAYTAGLLHDIGKIVLDQYVITNAPFFYRSAQRQGADLCSIEKERFGIDHPEIGATLAKKWELPDGLVDVIRWHHRPESSEVSRELVSIVYLADLLVARFRVGYQLDKPNAELMEERLANIGLRKEHFPIVVDRIPRAVFESSLMVS